MENDLHRDEIDELSALVKRVLTEHRAGEMETERTRDALEQIIATAAGQLGEHDRRAVGVFAEKLIGAVWSDTLSIDEACLKVERAAAAAAENCFDFHALISDE